MINPNSTSSMTDAMTEVARQKVPALQFEGWTSHQGPASIQGPEDGAAATPPLLELVQKASDNGAQGIIIGCFDDTALTEAARIARCPVLGIGQAAYHFAALRQWRFSVVTTLEVSVPIIETNVQSLGLGQHLGRVRASNVAVLELEDAPQAAADKVLSEALRAEQDDAIDAVVLGCAGMVQVTKAVQQALTINVIDPVSCAASCFAWLGQGLDAPQS